jgi:hypothetical protein
MFFRVILASASNSPFLLKTSRVGGAKSARRAFGTFGTAHSPSFLGKNYGRSKVHFLTFGLMRKRRSGGRPKGTEGATGGPVHTQPRSSNSIDGEAPQPPSVNQLFQRCRHDLLGRSRRMHSKPHTGQGRRPKRGGKLFMAGLDFIDFGLCE